MTVRVTKEWFDFISFTDSMFLFSAVICDLVKCSAPNSQCFVKANGQHECRCPLEDECPSSGDKVCGSDGKTYDNECKLKAQACKGSSGLVVTKQDRCGKIYSIALFQLRDFVG